MRFIAKIVSLLLLASSFLYSQVEKKTSDDYYSVVAQDGSGNFTSIQEAINASKSFPYKRKTIFIKNGIYHEKIKIHEWNPNLTLIGESKENTIITFDDYFNKINLGINSTFYTYTLLVEGDQFIAQNLTIKNTAGEVGQAVALAINADNVIISNCSILGNQDTLYVTGKNKKQYLTNCYIEGTTDFIFGAATVLFENCSIHSLKNSFVTAASTPEGVDFGFVFKKCKLTASANVDSVYLGRPWRIYAKTVFLDCELGNHILPEGWNNWSKPEAEINAFYAEYSCNGEGAKIDKRVTWSHKLKKNEANKYELETIFGVEFANVIKELKQN
jgi:pectinesterase